MGVSNPNIDYILPWGLLLGISSVYRARVDMRTIKCMSIAFDAEKIVWEMYGSVDTDGWGAVVIIVSPSRSPTMDPIYGRWISEYDLCRRLIGLGLTSTEMTGRGSGANLLTFSKSESGSHRLSINCYISIMFLADSTCSSVEWDRANNSWASSWVCMSRSTFNSQEIWEWDEIGVFAIRKFYKMISMPPRASIVLRSRTRRFSAVTIQHGNVNLDLPPSPVDRHHFRCGNALWRMMFHRWAILLGVETPGSAWSLSCRPTASCLVDALEITTSLREFSPVLMSKYGLLRERKTRIWPCCCGRSSRFIILALAIARISLRGADLLGKWRFSWCWPVRRSFVAVMKITFKSTRPILPQCESG